LRRSPRFWRTRVGRGLHEIIGNYYRLAPLVEHVVNHGDLALMNALWEGEVLSRPGAC
jgi:hypothetical protein